MTQEEKQLLLKDLCGRLLYRPKLQTYYKKISGSGVFDDELYEIDIDEQYCNDGRRLEDIKPYLHPLLSMTGKEREEFRKVGGIMSYNPQHDTWAISAFAPEAYDWLNKHGFDYRGLIPMGLALPATEGMYK